MWSTVFGQAKSDSSRALKEVIIQAWQKKDITRLPEVAEGFIIAGKKNEVVNIAGTNANISLKTGRQLFSKVPGVFVYEMDGSGNQINISTRGLDPHRSWEFNIRQNGVLTNSDMYGYPASHYSAPLESYEKIEIIRGTGSLQYGAQFGGMINYVTKKPDTSRPFSFESINTIGSYNLVSTYNAVSGTVGKFSYLGYYYMRKADGYRENSNSDASAFYVNLQYRLKPGLVIKGELGRSKYLYHMPGPLTDSMFAKDPQSSTRSRNYFSPDIYVPSLSLEWKLSPATYMSLRASGVYGNRSSVQYDAFANVPDTINPITGEFKNRQVDIDGFFSNTIEWKLQHLYKINKFDNTLVAGIVYMNNDLHRRQMGKGTTGSNYTLELAEPGFGRDLHFYSNNIAVFAENMVRLNRRWTLSAGLRMEKGSSDMKGEIKYYTVNPLPTTITHQFVLPGLSSQLVLHNGNTIYGGVSGAYRPVIFKDIIPASTYEQIDKDLKDAHGFNAELGARGKLFKYLQFDVTVFDMIYKHRMGTLVLTDDNGNPYTYRTNVGDSRTRGLEVFLQYKFRVADQFFAGVFTSTSYLDGRYTNGAVASVGGNKSIKGNRVEGVPTWISRNGIDLLYKGFSGTVLYSYTASSFSDPLNTVDPPASGAKGINPGYGLWDFNVSLQTRLHINVRAGVNNIFNKQYFTKRPTMYPGPGIWPGDGRNFYLTLGFRI